MKKIFYSIAAMSVLLTSCLKDEGYDNGPTGFKGNNTDRFVAILNPNETSGMATLGIFVTPAEETIQTFVVSITGPVQSKDVQVTLSLKPALIGEYNDANDESIEVLPTAAFELPTTVTVPAGKEYVSVPLKLRKNLIDPALAYALGVEVTGVDDPTVKLSGKSKQALIGIVVKNAYDGVYELHGVAEHPTNPTLAGPVGPTEWTLVTDGISSVVTATRHPWANGSGSGLPTNYNTVFTVDPATNKVTVSNANGFPFENTPGYDSRYDPTTKSIYAKWQYAGSGGNRIFTDTLVFLRPRD